MRKAGEILTALLNERFDPAFLERAESTVGLFSSWTAAAVDADISAAAAHSRIKELEKGVLLVEAEHPGWVQILQTRQVQLLKAVQRRYPDLGIQGISFCLSRDKIFTPEPKIPETAQEDETAVQDESVEKTGLSFEPVEDFVGSATSTGVTEDAAYIAAKKRLEASIKKRNKLR